MAPLERDDELAQLGAAVAAAREGHGRVVLLEGAAGIGKTALLDEVRRTAADGSQVLPARGGLLERDFGFGVVRQLLEAVARGRELPDAARAVLTDTAPVAALPADGGFAALNALFFTLVDLAAERPVVLAVDDLQWADPPSLRFLAYLARRVEDVPVLLVATVRTGEPGADEGLLGAVRLPPARVLAPGPLSVAGVGAVVSERLGVRADAAFAEACHRATAGNPLLVRELAAGLATDGIRPVADRAGVVRAIGPRAVSRSVAARLRALPPDALAVARAVAVLGDGVTVTDAAAFTGLERSRVAEVSGPLAGAEILRPEPPLSFVHPLVADAIVLTLAPGERELRHADAARMLHARGAPSEQVAGHVLRAPRDGQPWAVEVLRAAARTALQRGAAESAAAFLRRALEEPPPAEQRAAMLLEVGLVEAMTSGPQAAEHLEGALAALVEPAERALAAGALGRALLLTGQPGRAGAVAEAVAAELGEEHADLRDQLTGFGLMTAWFDDRAVAMGPDTAHLRDRIPGPGDGPGAHMLAAVASYAWCCEPAPREACAALARAALAGGVLLEADHGLLDIPPVVVLALAEDPAGHEYLEAGLAKARRSGSLYAAAGMQLWSTALQLWRGDLEEAEATGRQAIETMEVWRNDEGPDYGTAFLAQVLAERGDLPGARAVLGGRVPSDTAAEGTRHWHEARLTLLMAEGRDGDALATAELLATRWAHVRNPAMATWRLARAVLRHRAGDAAGARADLDGQLALAEAWGAPGPIGRALRTRGELLGAREDLERAVGVLAGSAVRMEHARALLALGRALRLEGRPADAREPLREALALAARCGSPGLAEEVRGELAAAGVRPRNEALSGPGALTPSERRVATMAAEGRTNRDIAQELFVTPKTVEVHLSAAYRKLGIASRRGLEGALAVPAGG